MLRWILQQHKRQRESSLSSLFPTWRQKVGSVEEIRQRKDWVRASVTSLLCYAHFREIDFTNSMEFKMGFVGQLYLKDTAVQSIHGTVVTGSSTRDETAPVKPSKTPRAAAVKLSLHRYWQTVQLKYNDGLVLNATLDQTVINQLQNPVTREELMKTIRQNANVTGLNTNANSNLNTPTGGESQNNVPSGGPEESLTMHTDDSDASDVEANSSDRPTSYTSWPREAILYLIELYKQNELQLEDPLLKKKDVWSKITTKMTERGYKFTQNKIECKWRSLLKSHKDVLENKKKTGAKRKTFQFFEQINEIVNKRHDINPQMVTGNICPSKPYSESNGSTETTSETPSESITDQDSEMSHSRSAKLRRENRKRLSTDNEVVKVLLDMEESRKEERREREKEETNVKRKE